MAPETLNCKTKEVVKKLLAPLSDRARDILVKRYGLGKTAKRMTLEAIGEEYGITRERVRQIENFALASIKKSDLYKKADDYVNELKKLMYDHGGVVHESEFLSAIGKKDELMQNEVHFLLVLSDAFEKLKED